jgi:Domain of unknown function (DUF1707)
MAAGGRGHVRASHTDRERVVETLKAAFVQGRLTKDELDSRTGQALAAVTYADLAALTADLNVEPAADRKAAPVATQPPRPDNSGVARGPFGPEAHSEGWAEAVGLFRRLAQGQELISHQPPGLMLEPGEGALGEVVAEYSRFSEMTVPYTQRSTFALGGPVFVAAALIGTAATNAAARRAAERQAAPQWRFEGFPRVILTSRRLLVHRPANYQWLSFWHRGLFEFGPELRTYSLYLGYPDCAPVMLRGPMVPWLSVALAACVYPRGQLAHLPFFSPFGGPGISAEPAGPRAE